MMHAYTYMDITFIHILLWASCSKTTRVDLLLKTSSTPLDASFTKTSVRLATDVER